MTTFNKLEYFIVVPHYNWAASSSWFWCRTQLYNRLVIVATQSNWLVFRLWRWKERIRYVAISFRKCMICLLIVRCVGERTGSAYDTRRQDGNWTVFPRFGKQEMWTEKEEMKIMLVVFFFCIQNCPFDEDSHTSWQKHDSDTVEMINSDFDSS